MSYYPTSPSYPPSPITTPWAVAKQIIRRHVDYSYGMLSNFGQNWNDDRIKNRKMSFTTDDIDATKRIFDEMYDDRKVRDEKRKREEDDVDMRRQRVRRRQDMHKDNLDKYGVKPGVFKVSRPEYTLPNFMRYDMGCSHTQFVVVAQDEEAARRVHPGYAYDAFTYDTTDPLAREEEWLEVGGFGPCPGWFLGPGNTWIHGGYAEVKRICDYEPPTGEEPSFGIKCSTKV